MASDNIPHSEEDRKTLKKKSRKAQWEEAAKDLDLLQDIADIEIAFRAEDAETLNSE
jgi:hypothetical protein